MNGLESVVNIDIQKAIIATGVMAAAGVFIFVKRRLPKYRQKTEEKA